ncbi:hypothetical protein EV421DRAFT_412745 [Armillaria borealis]|uniref:DUF6699 domain-containing protein n=1 Tax=Armillaria borealis TaxID=47425 RepID=A0AA39K4T7_9AGAR|nr:hypothetical protein EV421DRAFT_412745 [Armillaria borealis]
MDPGHSPRHRDPNVHPSRPILRSGGGGSRRNDGPSVQFQTLPTPSPRPATADSQPTHHSRITRRVQVPSRHVLRPEDLTTQQLRSQRSLATSEPARRRSLSHPASSRDTEPIPRLTRPTGKAEDCPEIETVMFGKWAVGPSYGPVLEPRTAAILQLSPILNPVFSSTSSSNDYLVWNMIFDPSTAKRVHDGVEEPFESFRHEPACFPRMTILNVISPSFPWILDLRSSDPNTGVTVGDVLSEIFLYLEVGLSSVELDRVPSQYRTAIAEAYRTRIGLVPEESFGFQLLDWLVGNTQFMGLSRDIDYIQERHMPVLPDLYVVLTTTPIPTDSE